MLIQIIIHITRLFFLKKFQIGEYLNSMGMSGMLIGGGIQMDNQVKYYRPIVGACDPCPPIRVKSYVTPPQLYLGFQPYALPQFDPVQALYYGTLWPALYSPYNGMQLFRGEDK
jgi:spore coat protein JA